MSSRWRPCLGGAGFHPTVAGRWPPGLPLVRSSACRRWLPPLRAAGAGAEGAGPARGGAEPGGPGGRAGHAAVHRRLNAALTLQRHVPGGQQATRQPRNASHPMRSETDLSSSRRHAAGHRAQAAGPPHKGQAESGGGGRARNWALPECALTLQPGTTDDTRTVIATTAPFLIRRIDFRQTLAYNIQAVRRCVGASARCFIWLLGAMIAHEAGQTH
jgi:hypothetical protein